MILRFFQRQHILSIPVHHTLLPYREDYIVEGSIPLGQLDDMDSITTLAGNTYDVTIEGNTILVGGYEVLTANIFATNGVIHVIDQVLLPPEG